MDNTFSQLGRFLMLKLLIAKVINYCFKKKELNYYCSINYLLT